MLPRIAFGGSISLTHTTSLLLMGLSDVESAPGYATINPLNL
jgi:hypothetical protein